MRKYTHLRAKARESRRDGKTLPEICAQLSLGRSTVYPWVKDIPISRTARQNDQLRKATRVARKKHEEQRHRWYEEAYQESAAILKDRAVRDFIVLYATEGYKRNRNQVSICNSNPNIMRVAHKCIKRLSNNRNIEYRLQCHLDNDESELKRYWAALLGIGAENVKVFRKSNAGQLSGRKWRSEYGVLTIRVGDTELRCKIEAWMDYIQQEWSELSIGA